MTIKEIKDLFGQKQDIYRTIEKVITYNTNQQERLKKEISEYIATDSIEEQFEKLLTKMQDAMDMGGNNEVGVWVSGFYGSGKSSFTKYLGLALDDSIKVDGDLFLKHLQDRLHKPQAKSLLSALAKKYPMAVVFLDLASEQVTGATMTEISNVLYYKVLQWAGFSRNLKVAALERRLIKDGRYDEFLSMFKKETGEEWRNYQNDELIVDSLMPQLAHRLYPDLFKTPTSFTTATSDFIYLQKDRIEGIIDIVRRHTNKQHILFIIDEVGQYIGGQQHKILDLQGIAENLKRVGDGKVWIIGTAQQTLTEDSQRAALNSPELYKLKDRFPIQIDLESKDIKEICYRRLLAKSATGEKALGDIFDKHGPALRHNTKLKDAKLYDYEFSKDVFINLYPFLPAHFDILLFLLGALAKSTGGFGLRSAIKVVQDILIESLEDRKPVAERPLGFLVTTVTLYDALEKDIQRAAQSIHRSVGKAIQQFPDSAIHHETAKTVAVLQILNNMPVTVENISGLMQDSVESSSKIEAVKKAISDLQNNQFVPFGEQDGNLRFFSEKLNDIEQERSAIPLRSVDTKRIFSEAVKGIFEPLPSVRIENTMAVSTGIKISSGAMISSLSGDRNPIQTIIEFVDSNDYDTARTRIQEETRQHNSRNSIYLIGRRNTECDEKVAEIFRCNEICQKYRTEPDQEVKEYCSSQANRAAKLILELQSMIMKSLIKGSFLFRGQITAVETLDADLIEASKKNLSSVAAQVFNRYSEASVRADTDIAEKLLRAGNLTGVTHVIDPLQFVVMTGGTPRINTDHKALKSIRDYLDTNGTVDGKRITEHFQEPPFGWSPDTLRYCVAALLVAGEIKLKISGREVAGPGDQAVNALKTNNTFKTIGVSLRDSRPSMDICARAAERLTEIIGEKVVPLEQDISKNAMKHLSQLNSKFASLMEKLASLELPGIDRIQTLEREIADMMFVDASNATELLGVENSALYASIQWAKNAMEAINHGLNNTIKELKLYVKEIDGLPMTGKPGILKNEVNEEINRINELLAIEDFYKHESDLNTLLTTLRARTRDAVHALSESLTVSIHQAGEDLSRIPEWGELTREEQSELLGQVDTQNGDVSEDIHGLKQLMNRQYTVQQLILELKESIERQGRDRRTKRLELERDKVKSEGKDGIIRSISIPPSITTISDLEEIIAKLNELKNEMTLAGDIRITVSLREKS